MQALVEHGHPPQVVEQYTVAKLWWYLGAITRNGNRQRLAWERENGKG